MYYGFGRLVAHCMLTLHVAGERPTRTEGASDRKDNGRSREKSKEDVTKEKQSTKKAQGQQDDIQGTNFIKRNIEVSNPVVPSGVD